MEFGASCVRSATALAGDIEGSGADIDRRNLRFGVEMTEVFRANPGATTGIENANVLAIGLAVVAKVIGCCPVPAPVIARRCFVKHGFRGEGVGVVKRGDGVGDPIAIRLRAIRVRAIRVREMFGGIRGGMHSATRIANRTKTGR